MISRRATLVGAVAGVGGLAAVGAQKLGVLDEMVGAVGIRPHAEPDPSDVDRLTRAAEANRSLRTAAEAALLASTLSVVERQFLATARRTLREQGHAVSAGVPAAPSGPGSMKDFRRLARAAADDRANDAMTAVSVAVAQVLASMAAGLDQLVEAGDDHD